MMIKPQLTLIDLSKRTAADLLDKLELISYPHICPIVNKHRLICLVARKDELLMVVGGEGLTLLPLKPFLPPTNSPFVLHLLAGHCLSLN